MHTTSIDHEIRLHSLYTRVPNPVFWCCCKQCTSKVSAQRASNSYLYLSYCLTMLPLLVILLRGSHTKRGEMVRPEAGQYSVLNGWSSDISFSCST